MPLQTSTGAFQIFKVAGQSDVVVDTASDTLTFVQGTGITITSDAATDTITFSASSSTPTGLTAGSTSEGFINYKGVTPTAGQMDGSTTAPTLTNRLNYNGYFYATRVYNAVFNDYAEYFAKADGDFEPGDVISIGLDDKYIKSVGSNDSTVVGVFSDDYAHCIGGNGDGLDEQNFIPIGLAGRVKVKVVGNIKKGDLLVSSSINGVATVGKTQGCIIGKALESYSGDTIGKIKMLILNA